VSAGGAAKPAPTPAPATGGGKAVTGGGAATGGVTSTGGPSTGGGASGGGHNATEPTQPVPPTPAPAPAPTSPPVITPCATIPAATASTGWVNGGTAIWHNIAVSSCDSVSENLDIEAIDKNPETGQVEYEHEIYVPVSGYGNTGATIDNDLIPYNTTYAITYNVYDADSGKLLATASGSATTPPPN
jgi:hypothetical protein